MQAAPVDVRRDIIRMLAEVIGYDGASAEAEGSNDAAASAEAFACGPAECFGLAQQLLALILELLGAFRPPPNCVIALHT